MSKSQRTISVLSEHASHINACAHTAKGFAITVLFVVASQQTHGPMRRLHRSGTLIPTRCSTNTFGGGGRRSTKTFWGICAISGVVSHSAQRAMYFCVCNAV